MLAASEDSIPLISFSEIKCQNKSRIQTPLGEPSTVHKVSELLYGMIETKLPQ